MINDKSIESDSTHNLDT